jgi:hypothetical protein
MALVQHHLPASRTTPGFLPYHPYITPIGPHPADTLISPFLQRKSGQNLATARTKSILSPYSIHT